MTTWHMSISPRFTALLSTVLQDGVARAHGVQSMFSSSDYFFLGPAPQSQTQVAPAAAASKPGSAANRRPARPSSRGTSSGARTESGVAEEDAPTGESMLVVEEEEEEEEARRAGSRLSRADQTPIQEAKQSTQGRGEEPKSGRGLTSQSPLLREMEILERQLGQAQENAELWQQQLQKAQEDSQYWRKESQEAERQSVLFQEKCGELHKV